MRHDDERDFMVPRLQRYEDKVLVEIAAEQVTRIDVREYAVGSARWEKLWAAIELANRYQWPRFMETI